MADSKDRIVYTCTHTRLREGVVTFYLVGLFTGSCLHNYPTVVIVAGLCSAIGIAVQWWRLQSLNERERAGRS